MSGGRLAAAILMVCVIGACGGLALAAESKTPADSGTAIGLVTEKDDSWIRVKPEGAEGERYTAKWVGLEPAKGGGFDKDMVAAIAKIRVGDKVEVKWTKDERKRIVELKVLQASSRAAEPKAGDTGTFTGTLTEKKDTWIRLKSSTGESQKFTASWVGGKDGGPDKDIIKAIGKLKVGQRVQVQWKFNESRRIVSMKVVNGTDASSQPSSAAAHDGETGSASGTVAEKGATFVVIKSADGKTERYVPQWKNGGPDKEIVAAIKNLKVGQKVQLKWLMNERLRVVEIVPL